MINLSASCVKEMFCHENLHDISLNFKSRWTDSRHTSARCTRRIEVQGCRVYLDVHALEVSDFFREASGHVERTDGLHVFFDDSVSQVAPKIILEETFDHVSVANKSLRLAPGCFTMLQFVELHDHQAGFTKKIICSTKHASPV